MAAANKCSSVTSHFHGHADALKQYRTHHWFSMSRATPEATATGRCHWATTSYSLRIAPAAARATSTVNKIMMQNVPTFLAVLKSVAVRRYYTVRIAWWRRSRAFIKPLNAAIERALAPKGINRTCLPLFWGFHCRFAEKGLELP